MMAKLINGKWQRLVYCQSCGWCGERRDRYTKPCPKCHGGRVKVAAQAEASAPASAEPLSEAAQVSASGPGTNQGGEP
jgi:DnaJ-class molecular chaperone